jgi:hypothetical protein
MFFPGQIFIPLKMALKGNYFATVLPAKISKHLLCHFISSQMTKTHIKTIQKSYKGFFLTSVGIEPSPSDHLSTDLFIKL